MEVGAGLAGGHSKRKKKQTRILSSCSNLGMGDYKEFSLKFGDSIFKRAGRLLKTGAV